MKGVTWMRKKEGLILSHYNGARIAWVDLLLLLCVTYNIAYREEVLYPNTIRTASGLLFSVASLPLTSSEIA
jgi:hypothetical protein